MSDESTAAEAVEAPESAEGTEALAEAAPTIEERMDALEEHVRAALAGAASAAQITAQLAAAAEGIHGRIDELDARVDILGQIAADGIGDVAGEIEPLAEPDADGLTTCGACGRRAAPGREKCARCGAALGDGVA